MIAAPSGSYVLEEQVGYLLRQAHQRATSLFVAEMGVEHQITPTQYTALVRLHEQGALSQNHLGRLSAMDPATIQGVIRRLVERGLIQRSENPGDRRRATLKLTAEGHKLVLQLIERGPRVSEVTLAPLAPKERKVFLDLLRRLA
jgi:DNA-binding MarR family transcriptional regulator